MFDFEDRGSDSPFVELIWRNRSQNGGPFTSIAVSHWQLVVTRHEGRATMTVRGPETKASHAFAPAGVGILYLFSDRETFFGSLTGLLVNGGSVILVMVMFNQLLVQRQKASELAESLESANAKLAAYNAKIETLTLQNERQRMARELHDTLAQGVAGLVLQLEAVKAHLASNRTERAASIVEQSIARARSTLAESRAAIDDLRVMPINITDSVREQVEHFKHATSLPCDLDVSVTENQLSAETINHALSILNESMTNRS